MSREWKPGDVALVEAGCWANRKVALRLDEGWSHVNGVNVDSDGVVTPVRPLLVIDPARLTWDGRIPSAAEFIEWAESLPAGEFATGVLIIADALRDLPGDDPKPPEPQTLGAIVRDIGGDLWIRDCPSDCPDGTGCIPWTHVKTGDRAKWPKIEAATIEHEGWQR